MTYSIIASESGSGRLGVAVQSCYLAVGTWVPWVKKGVGAIATQADTNKSYGFLGLNLLEAGKAPSEALQALLSVDQEKEYRQVSMIDPGGDIATHTGKNCVEAAGSKSGSSFCAQANMVNSPGVWEAMTEEYNKTSDDDLPDRLLSSLLAAEARGGDLRGKKSAALLVTEAGADNQTPLIDLRVDYSPRPLDSLGRLLDLHQAYSSERLTGKLIEEDNYSSAQEKLNQVGKYGSREDYLQYRRAIYLAAAFDQREEALEILKNLIARSSKWKEFLRRELESEHTRHPDVVTDLLEYLD